MISLERTGCCGCKCIAHSRAVHHLASSTATHNVHISLLTIVGGKYPRAVEEWTRRTVLSTLDRATPGGFFHLHHCLPLRTRLAGHSCASCLPCRSHPRPAHCSPCLTRRHLLQGPPAMGAVMFAAATAGQTAGDTLAANVGRPKEDGAGEPENPRDLRKQKAYW